MTPTLSLIDNPTALRRYRHLYLAAFWLTLLAFYASVLVAGYNPLLATLVCACAGIACTLKRMETQLDSSHEMISGPQAMALATTIDSFLVEKGRFLIRVDGLLSRRRNQPAEAVGIMLASLRHADASAAVRREDITPYRQQISQLTGTEVNQLDRNTFAIAISGPDVSERLTDFRLDIEALIRSSAPTLQITAGIALASELTSTPTDMLNTARAAMSLATIESRNAFAIKI